MTLSHCCVKPRRNKGSAELLRNKCHFFFFHFVPEIYSCESFLQINLSSLGELKQYLISPKVSYPHMARSVFAKLPTCCGNAMDPIVGSLSPNVHSAITRNLVCPLGGHHLFQGEHAQLWASCSFYNFVMLICWYTEDAGC